jgi:phosphoribosylformimino-5-aminoimidazole carboxamide ribotide isomerase
MVDSFTIFPALDLRGGRVVRLTQGEPNRQTTYIDNPHQWAERWKDEGADWLHVVNLDGAFGQDTFLTMQALETILDVGLKVEFGGGLRDQASIASVLSMGVKRVFLGTAAILDPVLVDWAIAKYGPETIAGDIAVRAGKVAIQGWQESTYFSHVEVGRRLNNHGITWCVLTDVRRDGTASGVNVEYAIELQNTTGLRVVASGGVSSLEDVGSVRKAGLAGVIIGRALYEGKLTIRECLKLPEEI